MNVQLRTVLLYGAELRGGKRAALSPAPRRVNSRSPLSESTRHYEVGSEGLMCFPPLDEEPALHFALLRGIARRTGLGLLSMGIIRRRAAATGGHRRKPGSPCSCRRRA